MNNRSVNARDRHPFLRMTKLTTLSVLATSVALSASAQEDGFDVSSQIGPDPVLPEPQMSLLPDMKLAEVVGWQEGQTPTVPEGFTVAVYAKDLVNPRTVHTLPNGDVLVVQGRGPSGKPLVRPKDYIRGWVMSLAKGGGDGPKEDSNLITLLRDTDRDGEVDERSDLLTDLNSPFGVAWIGDTLYVAAADAIMSYPYALGATEITEEPEVLTPLPGGPINHHWTKDLALSPDGTMLYASVGSNSNIAERGMEAEKGRAAIWQVDRETGASKIYASGLRNPNGLTFEPETGVLWAVINERDELGPNLVPDYMTSVVEGGFYGWPWSYFGDHVDERVYPPRPDMVERAISPDYALSSHVAPLGMTFSQGSAMPDPFASGAFVGEHGSWNRDRFNGYRVSYIPFENGKPAGKAVPFVTDFLSGDQARGRPVGVGIDGTGALLVADDTGNTVWRIAPSDGSVTPEPVGSDGQLLRVTDAAEADGDPAPEAATVVPETAEDQTPAPEVNSEESVEDSAGENDADEAVPPTPLTTVPAVNPEADQNSDSSESE